MRRILIILLSVFSCCLFQASDIFRTVESGNYKIIKQCLKNKSNLNVVNDQGQTILIIAVQAGDKALVKLLLKRKVDIDIVDNFGKTALDYAARSCREDIILCLAKKKAMVTNEENLAIVRDVIIKKTKKMAAVSSVLTFVSLGCLLPVLFITTGPCSLMYSLLSVGLGASFSNIPCSVSLSSWAMKADLYVPIAFQVNKQYANRLLNDKK